MTSSGCRLAALADGLGEEIGHLCSHSLVSECCVCGATRGCLQAHFVGDHASLSPAVVDSPVYKALSTLGSSLEEGLT